MKPSGRILLVLFVLVLVAPFLHWVLSMTGVAVVNPFSEESLRHVMLYGERIIAPPRLGLLVAVFTALGMARGCGLTHAFDRQATLLQRRARRVALLIMAAAALVYAALALWPASPVLSLSGHFKHSPLIHALPLYTCATLMASSIAYALSARTLKRWSQLPDLFTYGLHHATGWFYVLLILMILFL